jgi:hypothetical protein
MYAALALLTLISVLIGGCATKGPMDVCGWVEYIRPSRQDVLTEGTMRQIVEHNESVEAVCRK